MRMNILLTGTLAAGLSLSCSSRDQYDKPGDQTKEVTPSDPSVKIPETVTNPGAGLVDRYVEPGQEEIDAKNEAIAREPIVLKTVRDDEEQVVLAHGIGGVSFDSTIDDVIAKLGVPDVKTYTTFLGPSLYTLVYFDAKVAYFYSDNTPTEKPAYMLALDGYLGRFSTYDKQEINLGQEVLLEDVEVPADADVFETKLKNFAQKQFNFLHNKDLNTPCPVSACRVLKLGSDFYRIILQNVGFLSFTTNDKTVRFSGTILTKPIAISGNLPVLDIGKATIDDAPLGTEFEKMKKVFVTEPTLDDLGRGIRTVSFEMDNGYSASFKIDSESKTAMPEANAALTSVYASSNYAGPLLVNGKSICVTEAVDNLTLRETCEATEAALKNNSLSTGSLGRALTRTEQRAFMLKLRDLLKAELPNAQESYLSGVFDPKENGSHSFSLIMLDENFTGHFISISMGTFNNPTLGVSLGLIDGDLNSSLELSEVADVDGQPTVKLYEEVTTQNPAGEDVVVPQLRTSFAGVAFGSVVVPNIINKIKEYGTFSIFPPNAEELKDPYISNTFSSYSEDLLLVTAAYNSTTEVGSFDSSKVSRFSVNGITAFTAPIAGTPYEEITAILANYDLENLALGIPCLVDQQVKFGDLGTSVLKKISGSACPYLMPKEFGITNEINGIYLPTLKTRLLFSDGRLSGFLLNK